MSDAGFSKFLSVLARDHIPTFIRVVKTIVFIKEKGDPSVDPHLVVSVDVNGESDLKINNIEMVVLYRNKENSPESFIEILDPNSQLETVLEFLKKYPNVLMCSRTFVPFGLDFVIKENKYRSLASPRTMFQALEQGASHFALGAPPNFLTHPSA